MSDRKVFIDCGANVGDTIELFLRNFQNSHLYELYAFEPNEELTSNYNYKNLVVINRGVWISDEIKRFCVGNKNTSTNSRIEEFTVGRSLSKFSKTIEIECVDFSSWLFENFKREDYIILKMDIEGSEYDVLDKMITDESMSLVDDLYIEFHNAGSKTKAVDASIYAQKVMEHGVRVFGNYDGGKEFKGMFK